MNQNDKQQIIDGFSVRLNQVCDAMGVPPKGRNRQAALALLMGVSQKGARKWLEADGLPTFDKAIQIAVWSGVSIEWLLTGRGEMMMGRPHSAVRIAGTALDLPEDMARLVGKLAGLPVSKWRAIETLIDAFA